jgi:hypothetical protein
MLHIQLNQPMYYQLVPTHYLYIGTHHIHHLMRLVWAQSILYAFQCSQPEVSKLPVRQRSGYPQWRLEALSKPKVALLLMRLRLM